MVHSTPAAWTMARICNTALVEPPVAIMTLTAFSMDLRVTISRGLSSSSMALSNTRADSAADCVFSSCTLAMVDEYGRLMRSASKAELMDFAVHMAPHEPGPGIACSPIRTEEHTSDLPSLMR